MKIRGFTLVELLVVIAIIAILMAILMPALKLAKDQAYRIHCMSNVKTLSLAWFMYKDDNDGELVGGHIANQPHMWVHSVSGSATVEEKKQAIRDGALYPYVGNTVEVYRCPSDLRLRATHNFAYRSASIAGGANGEGWRNTYEQAKMYSDIKRPSEKYIFVEDVDPRGTNVGSWVMQFSPLKWIDPLAMWHNEQTTLGFADGHAEMHRWVDKYFIDWCKKAMHKGMYNPGGGFNFDLTPPANEHTDIEYALKHFPCISHD